MRELVPEPLEGWEVETVPSGSLVQAQSRPSVTVVGVGHQTRPAQLRAMIPGLAKLQTISPQGSYVLFTRLKPGVATSEKALRKEVQHWQDLVVEISLNLAAFPNPDRVDVVEYAPELAAKLSLIEAKLKIAPPRPSPLDQVKELVEATGDLRTANGKLSASAVATAFGVSLSQLAGWLDRSRQALSKTPDAPSVQDELAFFERVARLRAVLPKAGFLKWLRMSNTELDDKPPLELLAKGERQVVADLVEDMLTGAPA